MLVIEECLFVVFPAAVRRDGRDGEGRVKALSMNPLWQSALDKGMMVTWQIGEGGGY